MKCNMIVRVLQLNAFSKWMQSKTQDGFGKKRLPVATCCNLCTMILRPVHPASLSRTFEESKVQERLSTRWQGPIEGWRSGRPTSFSVIFIAATAVAGRNRRASRAAAQNEGRLAGPANLIPEEFFGDGQELQLSSYRMQLLQSEALQKQVRRDLGDELEDEVWESLKVNLRADVMDALKDEFEDEVRQTLTKELGDEMDMDDMDDMDEMDEVDDPEEDVKNVKEAEEVDDDFDEAEADRQLDELAAKDVEEIMLEFPTLSDELKKQVKEKVCEEMRKDMKVEVVLELKEDLRDQAEEVLMEELEAEARFELREELEEEVRNDLLWDG